MKNKNFCNEKIIEQALFCKQLMDRLYDDIYMTNFDDAKTLSYGQTRKQSDIVRLRRELNTLNKYLNIWE